MLASIAEKIASKGMSLEDVSTELRVGKNGAREFIVKASVSSPELAHRDDVASCVDDLSTLKSDLGLSTFDIRVHTN